MFGLMKDLAGLLNQSSLNTLTFQLRPLSGSFYINLPEELNNLTKGIQKKLQKKIKSLLVILVMMEFGFPCKKKTLAKLR